MDYKNRMLKVALTASILVSTSAVAECYVRTATNVKGRAAVQRVADVQYTKVPFNGLRKCTAQMRVQINGKWQDAEGEGVAETDTLACENARDIAKAKILLPVENASVDTESNMVCTDEPVVKPVEKVRINDWVKESELAIYKPYPKPFWYNGMWCKWFSYKEAHLGRPVAFAGVMCEMQKGRWQVVDLF